VEWVVSKHPVEVAVTSLVVRTTPTWKTVDAFDSLKQTGG
jgi:hypothetical protein